MGQTIVVTRKQGRVVLVVISIDAIQNLVLPLPRLMREGIGEIGEW